MLFGRIIKWSDWGIACEADPRHRAKVLEALGLEEDSKSVVMPGTREEDKEESEDRGEDAQEDTKFRAIAARLNFMAADMPDIQFATKEACREMSAPTRASWKKLKRIGRYLVGRSRVAWKFPWK